MRYIMAEGKLAKRLFKENMFFWNYDFGRVGFVYWPVLPIRIKTSIAGKYV